MRSHQEIAYALLRATVGVMLLFFGVGKFIRGHREFVSGVEERFAESWLPQALVTPFATVLPFVEVALGTLLVLGLFTTAALVLGGLLMMGLTFGTVAEPDPATTARNVNYALVFFVLLFLVHFNGYSVDRARGAGPRRWEGID